MVYMRRHYHTMDLKTHSSTGEPSLVLRTNPAPVPAKAATRMMKSKTDQCQSKGHPYVFTRDTVRLPVKIRTTIYILQQHLLTYRKQLLLRPTIQSQPIGTVVAHLSTTLRCLEHDNWSSCVPCESVSDTLYIDHCGSND